MPSAKLGDFCFCQSFKQVKHFLELSPKSNVSKVLAVRILNIFCAFLLIFSHLACAPNRSSKDQQLDKVSQLIDDLQYSAALKSIEEIAVEHPELRYDERYLDLYLSARLGSMDLDPFVVLSKAAEIRKNFESEVVSTEDKAQSELLKKSKIFQSFDEFKNKYSEPLKLFYAGQNLEELDQVFEVVEIYLKNFEADALKSEQQSDVQSNTQSQTRHKRITVKLAYVTLWQTLYEINEKLLAEVENLFVSAEAKDLCQSVVRILETQLKLTRKIAKFGEVAMILTHKKDQAGLTEDLSTLESELKPFKEIKKQLEILDKIQGIKHANEACEKVENIDIEKIRSEFFVWKEVLEGQPQ